jgi:hypothetical protein
MRFSYFKLALGVGFLSLVGWGVPGCGSSNSGSGGSGGSTGGTSAAGSGGTSTAGSGGTGTAGTGGSAGAAGSDSGTDGGTITCGTQTCTGANVIITTADPCCAGANQDQCGLDTTPLQSFGLDFNPACQAKHQPGQLDSNCPDFSETVSGIGITLPGCCHAATMTCGYMADTIQNTANLPVTLDMGCVDSTPFLEGGTPAPCGATDGGTDASTGGAAGAAGAGGTGP